MLSRFLKHRDLLLIFLTLMIGAPAVSGLINETNADSNGLPDFPFLMTTEVAASSIQSEQSEETVGEDPIVQEMAVDYYVKKYKVARKAARKRILISSNLQPRKLLV